MRATVSVKELQDVVRDARRVILARHPKKALQCVRLEVAGDWLTVGATDEDMDYLGHVEVEEGVPGVVLVEAESLKRALEGHKGLVTVEAGKVKGVPTFMVRSGTAVLSWPVEMPVGDWPRGRKVEGPEFTMAAGELRRVLRQVAPAMARGSGRYAIGGTCLELEDGLLRAVATDAHTLHASTARTSGVRAEGWTLPARAVDMLVKALPKVGDVVVKGRRCRIEREGKKYKTVPGAWSVGWTGRTVSGVDLEGCFPRWRDILPDKQRAPWVVRVERRKLLEAAKDAARGCTEEARAVAVIMPALGGTVLEMESRAEGVQARAEAGVTVERAVEEEVTVGLNPVFLCNALWEMVGPGVMVYAMDARQPVILEDDGSTMWVAIMPHNLPPRRGGAR